MNMFRGSMVAIATPMNEDGSIDFISLKNLFINITGTNPESIINKAGSEACSINSSCAN